MSAVWFCSKTCLQTPKNFAINVIMGGDVLIAIRETSLQQSENRFLIPVKKVACAIFSTSSLDLPNKIILGTLKSDVFQGILDTQFKMHFYNCGWFLGLSHGFNSLYLYWKWCMGDAITPPPEFFKKNKTWKPYTVASSLGVYYQWSGCQTETYRQTETTNLYILECRI